MKEDLLEHFFEKMWWAMCNAQLGWPVPIEEAALHRPFIYDRELGVMSCPSGYHQAAMALLYSFSKGHINAVEFAFATEGDHADLSELADRWLCEKPGRGFRSSVSWDITSGRPGSISAMEKRLFGRKVRYAFSHFDDDNRKNMPRGE